MAKVYIPRKDEQLLILLSRINARHEANKAESLLNAAFNMERLKLKLQDIERFNNNHSLSLDEVRLNSRIKRQEIRFISREVKGIRNLLMAIYSDEPHILEEWGFELQE